MGNRPGFSLVELTIVIGIIGILTVLATFRVGDSAIKARDAEREADTSTLAAYLESWQKGQGQGNYPSTTQIANNTVWVKSNFLGIDLDSLSAPGTAGANSVVAATDSTQTTAGVKPQPTIAQYVYQPLKKDGTLCSALSDACSSFNMFYRKELGSVVTMVESLER
jgi:prepilin-type N-terminal cleavage/methylation domain-containing protein